MSDTECSVTPHGGDPQRLFTSAPGLIALPLVVLIVWFALPLVYLIRRWDQPNVTPRSPIMIALSLTYLFLDAAGNTVLFALDPLKHEETICWLGVMITLICQFGLMEVTFLRMFRIYKVFSEYESYLLWQKQQLADEVKQMATGSSTFGGQEKAIFAMSRNFADLARNERKKHPSANLDVSSKSLISNSSLNVTDPSARTESNRTFLKSSNDVDILRRTIDDSFASANGRRELIYQNKMRDLHEKKLLK